jgi:hypothetical protein
MAIKKSNTVKLTTEEVTELNELRIKTSELTFQRGQLGIAEDNIKRQLNQLAEKFNELYTTESEISSKLFEKYGKGEVNLEEGTFTTEE